MPAIAPPVQTPFHHPRERSAASINVQLEKVVAGDDFFELRVA
ncbi:hypothetical protein ACH82I_10220 [Brevibacterium sp. GP-SGM9]